MQTRILFIIGLYVLLCNGCSKEDTTLDNATKDNPEYIVSLEDAIQIASSIKLPYEEASTKSITKSIKSKRVINRGSDLPYFYLINYEGGGFIILSGDKRVSPIMAYSDDGCFSFDETQYPDGLCVWMDNVIDSISNIRAKDIEADKEITALWNSFQTKAINPPSGSDANEMCYSGGRYYPDYEIIRYGPFMSTRWKQGEGYNDALPNMECTKYLNGRPPVGCVALAAAQLMKYFHILLLSIGLPCLTTKAHPLPNYY